MSHNRISNTTSHRFKPVCLMTFHQALSSTYKRTSFTTHNTPFRNISYPISGKLNILLAPLTATSASISSSSENVVADVCVIGAGIIGLTIAHTLLESDPKLSIAILDSKEPCAGATGAGQGYVWMTHRQPNSNAWELAARSKSLWETRLHRDNGTRKINIEAIEWQSAGSMLVATTEEESKGLRTRATTLNEAGVKAMYVDADKARQLEPSLSLKDEKGSGLVVPGDSQINGRQTTYAMLAACQEHPSRFLLLCNEGCSTLLRNKNNHAEVHGVETTCGRKITARRGVVVAAGAWSGEFLSKEFPTQTDWANVLKPRKGHLLEMPRPKDMPILQRGLMEVGYTKHYNSGSAVESQQSNSADITFTATTSASGSLLVGSSRDFLGWSDDVQEEVVDAVMNRAIEFLPGLSSVKREDISVRIGLRPFSSVGAVIGPVGIAGLYIASGHEGSGLTLALATGELIAEYILGRKFSLSEECVEALLPRKVSQR